MHRGQFGHFLKCCHFSNIWCFLERFFAHKKFNVVVQSFFAPFWHFSFLTQTDHFAWAKAHASWPISRIFKMLSFFDDYVFFGAFFCTQQV